MSDKITTGQRIAECVEKMVKVMVEDRLRNGWRTSDVFWEERSELADAIDAALTQR